MALIFKREVNSVRERSCGHCSAHIEHQMLYLFLELCTYPDVYLSETTNNVVPTRRVYDKTHSRVWYGSVLCVTWLIPDTFVCTTLATSVRHDSCVTNSYVWLIHMCVKVLSYARHVTFIRVTWLIHNSSWWHGSSMMYVRDINTDTLPRFVCVSLCVCMYLYI